MKKQVQSKKQIENRHVSHTLQISGHFNLRSSILPKLNMLYYLRNYLELPGELICPKLNEGLFVHLLIQNSGATNIIMFLKSMMSMITTQQYMQIKHG